MISTLNVINVNAESQPDPAIAINEYVKLNNRQDIKLRDCFRGDFGDYDKWRDRLINRPHNDTEEKKAAARAWIDSELPRRLHQRITQELVCNWMKYPVDGGYVEGYIVQPKKAEGKTPVLIYNRGGNLNYGGVVFGSMFHRQFIYALAGYTVMGSQYRGTFTKPQTDFIDQFGGDDINDVMALFDIIPDIRGVDPTRIGMLGGSRGAMQTLMAMRQGANIQAAVVLAGVYNLEEELAWRPEMQSVYKLRIPNYEQNKTAELEKRSALFWVDELDKQVPILILHGQADVKTNPLNSLKLASALQKKQHPYGLVIYPNADHSLRPYKKQANQAIIDWMDKYLKPRD